MYATISGGYDEIIGGHENKVFEKILGVKTEEREKKDITKNELLQKIKKAEINKGALITTGKFYKKESGHAYIIKGVYTTYDVKTKKNIDCIVVKNPHCKGNFNNEEMILIQLKIN